MVRRYRGWLVLVCVLVALPDVLFWGASVLVTQTLRQGVSRAFNSSVEYASSEWGVGSTLISGLQVTQNDVGCSIGTIEVQYHPLAVFASPVLKIRGESIVLNIPRQMQQTIQAAFRAVFHRRVSSLFFRKGTCSLRQIQGCAELKDLLLIHPNFFIIGDLAYTKDPSAVEGRFEVIFIDLAPEIMYNLTPETARDLAGRQDAQHVVIEMAGTLPFPRIAVRSDSIKFTVNHE